MFKNYLNWRKTGNAQVKIAESCKRLKKRKDNFTQQWNIKQAPSHSNELSQLTHAAIEDNSR